MLKLKLSENFTKTSKSLPAGELSRNAQLLIQAGYIHKEMAGVYGFLPLGLAVLENIKSIVREEMNKLGAQEILMTNLQRKDIWEKTERWDEKKVDVWFKTHLQNGNELGLAWSHEEPLTDMMRNFIASYRDLPAYLYQFQTKLRNELRAKSGIMRCREFLMKDMYSFSASEQEHQKFYDRATQAYHRVFERVGLGKDTYLTFASGGAFTQFSHEFQTLVEAGEDTIYLDRSKKIAINEEVLNDETIKQLGVKKSDLEKLPAAEVGNIFSFGVVKSEQLGLYFSDQSGKEKLVTLGSYGIGVSRLMGVLAEYFADESGLAWPDVVAPARAIIVPIGNEAEVKHEADKLFEDLAKTGVGVIYDDRDASPGEKLADADLLGIPWRIVISKKTISAGKIEIKYRKKHNSELLTAHQAVSKLLELEKK